MSADDTTIFVFRGTAGKGEQWYLLSGKIIDINTSRRSVYNSSVGGTYHLNKTRVQSIFTITGQGLSIEFAFTLVHLLTSLADF